MCRQDSSQSSFDKGGRLTSTALRWHPTNTPTAFCDFHKRRARSGRAAGSGDTAVVTVDNRPLWAWSTVAVAAAAVVLSLPFAFTGLGMVLAAAAMVVALPLGLAAPAPATRRLGKVAMGLAGAAIVVHVVVYVFSIV